MSCLICTDSFNNTTRKEVTCEYCSFTACRKCCQHYICSNMATECMNPDRNEDGLKKCGKEWTRYFVSRMFTTSFINNEWKNMKEKLFSDQQKALLPATMANVEAIKNREKIELNIDKIDELISDLRKQRQTLWRSLEYNDVAIPGNKEKNFQRPCADPNCKGYINSQWNCALCEKHTCKDCNIIVIKKDEHVCQENDKLTFEFLKKDTKPCVKCHIPIHKIEGCDQMWCTQCHTAFSWRTGRIETKIHNPHFFEYQRSNGTIERNPLDIECGRQLDNITSRKLINNYTDSCLDSNIPKEDRVNLASFFQRLSHLQHYEINRYITDNVADHLQLRIDYLMNKITDEQFAHKIQRNVKAFEKKKDLYNICRLFIQLLQDSVFILLEKIVEGEKNYKKNKNEIKIKFSTYIKELIIKDTKIFEKEIFQKEAYINELLVKHKEAFKSAKLIKADIFKSTSRTYYATNYNVFN